MVGDDFGQLLRILRRRARLTQAELGIAVGYSDAQISRLESGRRAPDLPTLIALFFPALGLELDSQDAQTLLRLAAPGKLVQPATSLLPAASASLIGRRHERAALAALLAQGTRLITLVGPPGVGKTALARQALAESSEAGLWIELGAVENCAQVPGAIAQALGLALDLRAEPFAALAAALGEQHRLLVLDTIEQLLPELARPLGELLQAAPGLVVLATSRRAVRIKAEHVAVVAPLPLPELGQLPEHSLLEQNDAMALLLARLRESNPDFRLDAGNALALAAICTQVDGLPLAIELVAARGHMLTPAELLAQVTQQSASLTRRSGEHSARHQSLPAAIQWSYNLLDAQAQQVLARLSVFRAGWNVELARLVCDLPQAQVLDSLETLLDHSLILRAAHGQHSRFQMLAVVQHYAAERLAESEHEATHLRHAVALAQLCSRAEAELLGPEQETWHARLDAEIGNIRAALTWAAAATVTDAREAGMQIASGLERFWQVRGLAAEGAGWLDALLDTPGEPQAASCRAKAMLVCGILRYRLGQFEPAASRLQASRDLFLQAGDRRGESRALNNLGNVAYDRGALEEAAAFHRACLSIRRELGDLYLIASSLNNLGLCVARHNKQEATAVFAESLALYRQIGEVWSVASVLGNLAQFALEGGDLAKAAELYEEARVLRDILDDRPGVALMALGLGDVAWAAGTHQLAESWYVQALARYHELRQAVGMAQALICLARLASGNDGMRAGQLLGAAQQVLRGAGAHLPEYDQENLEHIQQGLEQRLGKPAAQAAHISGALLSVAELLERLQPSAPSSNP